jgi:hypothetical protein
MRSKKSGKIINRAISVQFLGSGIATNGFTI